MEIEIRKTNDGSDTLYLPSLSETYHSTHGAMQEAIYVFLKQGLHFIANPTIKILEVGFGTALNCWLTCLESSKFDRQIDYTGIEKFPLPESIWQNLNYSAYLNSGDALFNKIHLAAWNEKIAISKNFELKKWHIALQDLNEQENYDLIYYDAFGPRAQPEMWELPQLKIITQAAKNNCVLVTYCAQGAFKRNLKYLGWTIEELPGPAGKRQMTRAIKLNC